MNKVISIEELIKEGANKGTIIICSWCGKQEVADNKGIIDCPDCDKSYIHE